MTLILQNNSEIIFKEICSHQFLKGFVFHSPKIYHPTEIEIGDVLIWARTLIINFELIWRNPVASKGIKSFTKRIGYKRDQLKKDYEYFSHPDLDIILTNESNISIKFPKESFASSGYIGVVLVDSQDIVIKLHYHTIRKTFELPFSCLIITFDGFKNILQEVDTIYDLAFYFKDRFNFSKYLFKNHPNDILELNPEFERQLIAFYKMNDNSFPEDLWDESKKYEYWNIYNNQFREQIEIRNQENEKSYIVDKIIDHLFSKHDEIQDGDVKELPLHAWELATLTRRQRATVLADKLIDAFERMNKGNRYRYFSFLNQTTGCWLLFYFMYGEDTDKFKESFEELIKLKIIYEVFKNSFRFSIFGYGFRKSSLSVNTEFDEVLLLIEDAENVKEENSELLHKAEKMFGKISVRRIVEFPNK